MIILLFSLISVTLFERYRFNKLISNIQKDKKMLCDVLSIIKKNNQLSLSVILSLSERFGDLIPKALKVLRYNRAKKIFFPPSPLVLHIVIGHSREYMLMPEVWYCSCKTLYFKSLISKSWICYHLLAYKIGEALNNISKTELDFNIYDLTMKELK